VVDEGDGKQHREQPVAEKGDVEGAPLRPGVAGRRIAEAERHQAQRHPDAARRKQRAAPVHCRAEHLLDQQRRDGRAEAVDAVQRIERLAPAQRVEIEHQGVDAVAQRALRRAEEEKAPDEQGPVRSRERSQQAEAGEQRAAAKEGLAPYPVRPDAGQHASKQPAYRTRRKDRADLWQAEMESADHGGHDGRKERSEAADKEVAGETEEGQRDLIAPRASAVLRLCHSVTGVGLVSVVMLVGCPLLRASFSAPPWPSPYEGEGTSIAPCYSFLASALPLRRGGNRFVRRS